MDDIRRKLRERSSSSFRKPFLRLPQDMEFQIVTDSFREFHATKKPMSIYGIPTATAATYELHSIVTYSRCRQCTLCLRTGKTTFLIAFKNQRANRHSAIICLPRCRFVHDLCENNNCQSSSLSHPSAAFNDCVNQTYRFHNYDFRTSTPSSHSRTTPE